MEETRQQLEEKFLEKTDGIVKEFEKQKLPLSARVCVWIIRRKLKKYR